ncbi:NAD(P)-dependent dehydrogenase (short-subunit alcohol dehydrogenase family) [Sphingomonas zeicaulis]|uniref:SDR family NAD(P)-dependent oxidoreductase n=1 Tax=Sphingomonas zeicaulis TaxID=1632740 RepID=UPI003D19F42D
MAQLEGKVAVVTGGNSGIGYAIAGRFVADGARVLIVGRRADAVEQAVAGLGAAATGVVGDIAEIETHRRVAAVVAERFGKADIYVANAGANTLTPTQSVSPAEYEAQFAINARGPFFGVQAILPHLADGGALILVGSIAATKVLENHAVYAASKAAVAALARGWAIEFAPRRIRVNLLSPGPVATPILGKLGIDAAALPAFEAAMAQAIPLGRLGQPEDVAEAALFLASDASRFVTGIDLRVDGGIALT